MPSSIGRSPSWVRRSSCSGILWKGSTLFGLRWFAALELTLARPKAPHIARRALSVSPIGHVHRPAPIAMRPLRQKSSRFLSRGALEASQSRGLVSRLTGGPCPPIKRRTEGLRIRTCCRRHVKGGLARRRELSDLKDMGHKLKVLWRAYKADFPDPALKRHDKTISGLDKFEDIRYPDAILKHGMGATAEWSGPAGKVTAYGGIRNNTRSS